MPGGNDPYQNPGFKPYVGSLQWVPKPSSNLGGAVPGPSFANLVLDRGAFRNDTLKPNHESITVSGVSSEDIVSESLTYPFWKAHRPVSNPSGQWKKPNGPLILTGGQLRYQIDLKTSNRISAITCEAKIDIDLMDKDVLDILDDADKKALQIYQSNPNKPKPKIDWTKYALLRVKTTGGVYINNRQKKAAFTYTEGKTKTITIRLGDSSAVNPENFSTISQLVIEPLMSIKSLSITIEKFLIFNAERVNIQPKQLPCVALQYAYAVKFGFDPASGIAIYPNNNVYPNFHVKCFSPDHAIESPGFAHGAHLRFLIFSVPAIGIAPGDDSSLAGLGSQMDNPGAYLVSFVGPRPGYVQMAAYGRLVPHGNIISLANVQSISKVRNIEIKRDNKSIAIVSLDEAKAGYKNHPWFFYDIDGLSTSKYTALANGNEFIIYSSPDYLTKPIQLLDGKISSSQNIQIPSVLLETALSNIPTAIFEYHGLALSKNSLFLQGLFSIIFAAQNKSKTSVKPLIRFALSKDGNWSDNEITLTIDSGGKIVAKLKKNSVSTPPYLGPEIPTTKGLIKLTRLATVSAEVSNALKSASNVLVGIDMVHDKAISDAVVEVTIDSSFRAFMPFVATRSNTISVTQQMRFDDATFKPFPNGTSYEAFYVSRKRVNSATDSSSWLTYKEKIKPKNSIPDANLLILDTFESNCNIKLDHIADTGSKLTNYVDFVTSEIPLNKGRVKAIDDFTIVVTLDRDIDTDILGCRMSIDALIYSEDGQTIYTVLESDIVTDNKDDNQYTFKIPVDLGFAFESVNPQICLRLRYASFWRDGSAKPFNTAPKLDAKPNGLRVQSIQLSKHSFEYLAINQVESLSGSPAFFENLPIDPGTIMGVPEFWYTADTELLKFVIGFPGQSISIEGAFYSPAWKATLPQDMEVQVRAASLRIPVDIFAKQLWIRTVPGSSEITAQPLSLSAAAHPLNDQTIVVFSKEETEVTSYAKTIDNHYIDNQSPTAIQDSKNNKFIVTNPSIRYMNEKAPASTSAMALITGSNADSNFIGSLFPMHALRAYDPSYDMSNPNLSQPKTLIAGSDYTSTWHSNGIQNVCAYQTSGALTFTRYGELQFTANVQPHISYLVDGEDIENAIPFKGSRYAPNVGWAGLIGSTSIEVIYGSDNLLLSRDFQYDGFREARIIHTAASDINHIATDYSKELHISAITYWSDNHIYLSIIRQGMQFRNFVIAGPQNASNDHRQTFDTEIAEQRSAVCFVNKNGNQAVQILYIHEGAVLRRFAIMDGTVTNFEIISAY